MRATLPLLLLLVLHAAWEPARADQEDQHPDATVARADAGSAPTSLPSADATSAAAGPEAAVRRLISSYRRAIETQDVELFRFLMPDMDADARSRLRASFEAIGSQRVDMAIDSIDIDGATAIVRVSRTDTVDGRRMKLIAQRFHLVRRGGGWRIQSLSVGR